MLRRLIVPCYEPNFPPRLPKLNPRPIAQPYITSTDGIARADRTRLVDDKDRQITARRIEKSVSMKEKINKVGDLRVFHVPPMTKNIIPISLTQKHRSRLGYTLCTPDSLIIVTQMVFRLYKLVMYSLGRKRN